MTNDHGGRCDVCGQPGPIHLTEARDGQKTSQTLCTEHAPPELRAMLPTTPAEEIAQLRRMKDEADRQVADPAQREKFKAAIEQMIASIERNTSGDQ